MEDGNDPATRADLRAEITASGDRVLNAMHDMQTELVNALHGFTEAVQLRFKEADKTEPTLKERLTSVETRLLQVEKRLNMPPSQ